MKRFIDFIGNLKLIFQIATSTSKFHVLATGVFAIPVSPGAKTYRLVELQFKKSPLGEHKISRKKIQKADHAVLFSLIEPYLQKYKSGQIKIADIPYIQGRPEGFKDLGYTRRNTKPEPIYAEVCSEDGEQRRMLSIDIYTHKLKKDRQICLRFSRCDFVHTGLDVYKNMLSPWLRGIIKETDALNDMLVELKCESLAGTLGSPGRVLEYATAEM